MATKLTLSKQLKQQRKSEVGDSTGTYFAIVTMAALLVMVSVYFWIENGNQVLASPTLQQNERLTPHDAY